MTKKELRKSYLSHRREMPQMELDALTERLMGNLWENVSFEGIKCVHLFLPIAHHNEVDMYLLVDALRLRFPEIKLVVPKSEFQTNEMVTCLLERETELEVSQWGIPEPKNPVVVDNHEIDLVFTPLLAFDEQGYRVGYGKGFYDRFFAKCRQDVKKIGVSLHGPIPKISDVNEFDARLDGCVTPDEFYEFD